MRPKMSLAHLALFLLPLFAVTVSSCKTPPPPPVHSDAAVSVTGTPADQLQQALDLLDDGRYPGAVSAAIAVVTIWPGIDPVDRSRALQGLRDAKERILPEAHTIVRQLREGLADAQCRAHAVTIAIVDTLSDFADFVARQLHWDVSSELQTALGLAGRVADVFAPQCVPDAGWSSVETRVQESARQRSRTSAPPHQLALRPFPTQSQAQDEARRATEGPTR